MTSGSAGPVEFLGSGTSRGPTGSITLAESLRVSSLRSLQLTERQSIDCGQATLGNVDGWAGTTHSDRRLTGAQSMMLASSRHHARPTVQSTSTSTMLLRGVGNLRRWLLPVLPGKGARLVPKQGWGLGKDVGNDSGRGQAYVYM